ncbi:MAG: glycogen synthase, partial [Deltaproteobacteria bacterium]|nr:glycogen synthase [Deltaproteobacteria bacterium]
MWVGSEMTVEEGYKNESGLVQTGLVPAASILPVLTPRNGNSFEKNGHGLVEVELDFPVNVKSGRKVTPPKTLPHDFCLKDVLRFLATPRAEVDGHIVKIILPFCINLDQELMDNVSFFVRWGSYDDIPERWRDVKVRPRELTKDEAGHYSLCKELRVYKRGRYGATVYATTAGENAEKVWQGRADLDDAKFNIESDSVSYVGRLMRVRRLYRSEVEKLVRARLTDWEESDFSMDGVRLTPTLSRLSRVIFDCSRTSTKWRGLLSKYYQEAVRKLQAEQTDELKSSTAFVVNLLGNIGLGDVIMVAPEGPHASAGGLAQVMNGLMTSLPSHGVPVTLISPLYEHEQGNIHKSADQILREGIHFNGQTMELKWVGEIDVPFGPTYQRGTQHHRDQAHLARSVVYQAELGNVRMLLIRNSRYADYLYSAVRADEQLRRAIFISRAALEVLRNPIFGLHPQLILSNDWVTALVPVFHKLDLRYSCADNLRDSKTLHLLHNCGRDYHGCIPFTFDNKDLWPMLELDPLHAYGMRDPQNPAMINLTAGAIFHLNGALLAVSKPYAQQLLTLDGGGGLDKLVENRRKAVFGISNGIDQKSLRSTIVKIGGKNLAKL